MFGDLYHSLVKSKKTRKLHSFLFLFFTYEEDDPKNVITINNSIIGRTISF